MNALTLEQASHLARRSGFAATTEQTELLMSADSQEGAISLLLEQTGSLVQLPGWFDEPIGARPQTEEERMAFRRQRREQGLELKYWWFGQMLSNKAPLQEKMTLFWANHFTSSLQKVKSPQAMLSQNLLLREHAIGSFREMLAGIIKDPAMLVYLDNASSRKEAPNENFARELLELFTLGEGNYSETDIKELARALTGASVNRRTGNYLLKRRWHDTGSKTLFGESGAFGPDDVTDIILRQPSLGEFISGKLWRFFIGNNPADEALQDLAQTFVDTDFSISALLNALFNRSEFWQSGGQLIKSPMELLVGSLQMFSIAPPSQRQFVGASKAMQQDLLDPPTVKGWPGGFAWYTTSTLSMRERVLGFISREQPDSLPLQQMLATAPVARLPSVSHDKYVAMVLHDPAYQVV